MQITKAVKETAWMCLVVCWCTDWPV